MLTYVTTNDFARIKQVSPAKLNDNPNGALNIEMYLRGATQLIDTRTFRTFFPHQQVNVYSIPRDYIDLRARALYTRDLELGDDLLEAYRVQTGGYSTTNSGQVVPSGVTPRSGSFTVTDASGFSVGDFLRIDTETLIIDEIDSNTLYVLRGQVNTRAAAHSAGAIIYTLNITTLNAGIDYQPLDFNVSPTLGLRVNFPNTWSASYGNMSTSSAVPSIYITGAWGYHAHYKSAWVDTLDSVEDNPLTSSATTITVNDADGTDASGMTRFAVGNLIRVDNEFMAITAITTTPTNTLTVLRAQRGTRATSHVKESIIERWHVPDDLALVCFSIAKIMKDADQSVGARQGVSDQSAGAAIALPDDAVQWIKMHKRRI